MRSGFPKWQIIALCAGVAVLLVLAALILAFALRNGGENPGGDSPVDIVEPVPAQTVQPQSAPQLPTPTATAETAPSPTPVPPEALEPIPIPALPEESPIVPAEELQSTPVPEETAEPAVSTPTPTPTPPETAAPLPTSAPAVAGKPLSGLVIGVDPGHQAKANREQEPVAPGAGETKNKVSSGTRGVATGIAEHEVNLAVGLLLRDLLEGAGAEVVMVRTSADVDISNAERAQIFNENRVDLGIRLHCNGSTDEDAHGAFMLVPRDKDYPFYAENVRAAELILEAYAAETGLSTRRGITYRDDQTGFNWCERPVVNIEMGHMTNAEEDRKLTDADFQKRMATGIYKGIAAYFAAP